MFKSKKRLIEVDLLRAIAIILIVVVHLDNYLVNSHTIRLIDSYLALIGLSFFFFISGFIIHRSENIYTSIDIIAFYKKRLYRILPLYWLSLIVCVIVFEFLDVDPGNLVSYNIDLINFSVHMFGMQVFLPKYEIQSMWFIGVILLYYLLYPIVIRLSKNVKYLTINLLLAMVPFVVLLLMFNLVDMRFIIYYSAFVGGILSNQINLFSEIKYKKYMYSFSIILALIILLQIFNTIGLINYTNIRVVPSVINSIFVFSVSIVSYWFMKSFVFLLNKRIIDVFSKISYGSYAVYLFHHEFLAIFRVLLNLLFNDSLIIDLLIILFGLPILFVFGYLIQKSMNNLIASFG